MLRVQAVKRELLLLRKAMRPLIEIVDLLPKLHSPMGEKWVQVKDDRVPSISMRLQLASSLQVSLLHSDRKI